MLTVQSNTGVILAYLNNLESATVKESINGEFLLDFIAVIEPLKTSFLYDNENLIEYNNDLFRVMILEELHNEDNMLTVAVTAVHISYDLIKSEFLDFNYTNTSAVNVMTQCLLGTGFTLTSTDVTLVTSIQYTEECNAKQISIAIANNWQGELQYYRRDIKLLKQRGQQRGTEFRFGKNLRSIKRIRNFADNTVAYDINVEQGAELGELGYYELGDTVKVVDEALNIGIEVRIIELEKDVMTGLNSKVVLGNELKDLRSSFNSLKKDVADTRQIIANSAPNWDKINDITNELGNIIPAKIVGDLSLAVMSILNGTGTFEQRDNMQYWQNQPTKANSTFASMWNANGISFANSKNAQGEWIWRSALGAGGLIADKVTTAAISSMSLEAVSALIQNLVAQTITGVTIEGSTIYAGNRFTGTYTQIDSQGRIKGFYENKPTYVLDHASEGRLVLGFNLNDPSANTISLNPFGTLSTLNGNYSGPVISVNSGKDLILSASRIVMQGTLVSNP